MSHTQEDRSLILNEPVNDNNNFYVDNQGTKWYSYSLDFDVDTVGFTVNIWAQNDEHANMVLAYIKQNGRINGRVY